MPVDKLTLPTNVLTIFHNLFINVYNILYCNYHFMILLKHLTDKDYIKQWV